jgi:hypothetical protein
MFVGELLFLDCHGEDAVDVNQCHLPGFASLGIGEEGEIAT